MQKKKFVRDLQYYKFCLYGFLKNLRFFDPFIILFFREIGLSFLEIGILFSVREVATNIFEMPTGIIADAVGRRKSMVFAFASYIVAFAVFYFFKSYTLFLVAMVIFALGEAFRTGTHKAMILEYLRLKNMLDVKVHYYGSTRSCSQFGSAISSLIAAALVFWSGSYRIIFGSSVIPAILGLLLMLSYPKELDGVPLKKKGKDDKGLKIWWKQIKDTTLDFVHLFKTPELVRTMFNSSLFDGFFKTIKDYIQPILKNFVLALPFLVALERDKRVALLVGVVYFFIFLLTSYASKSGGQFEQMFHSFPKALNMTYLFGALIVFLTGLFYSLGWYVATILLFVLYYVLQNLRRPISVSYVSDLISSRVMASGLSAESQMKTIVIAILSVLLGYLADKLGIGPALIVFSLLYFVSFVFVRLRGDDSLHKAVKNSV